MALWLKQDRDEVPDELLVFDPDDWVLRARDNAERLQMALDRWYGARWNWILEDPSKRPIDGLDAVEILFEDTRSYRSS